MDVDLPSIRRGLDARRVELADEVASLTEPPTYPVGNLSFGKRIGDGTAEAVERLSTTAAARSLAAALAEVERALEKIAEGNYGRCDSCLRTIPAERLEAVPWAALCVACRAQREI